MPRLLPCVLMVACVPAAPGPALDGAVDEDDTPTLTDDDGGDNQDTEDDDPEDTGDTEDTPSDLPPCNANFESHWSWPVEGDDQFYAGNALYFEWSSFDGEDFTDIVVETSSGQTVAGTSTHQGDTYRWTAPSGLDFDTSYTATALLETCSVSVDFATNDVGSAPADLDCLEDATYLVDMASARWIAPEGVGTLLSSYLTEVYVQALDVSTTSLTAMAAMGDGAGNQDLCAQTIDLPSATFANPDWEIPAGSATLVTEGMELVLEEFHATGTFSPDCSRVGNVHWTALLDTEPLDAVVGYDVCALMPTFGVNCVACPSGGNNCLESEMEDVRGVKVSLDLVPVSEQEASECN